MSKGVEIRNIFTLYCCLLFLSKLFIEGRISPF